MDRNREAIAALHRHGIAGAVADLVKFHQAFDIPILAVPQWPSDERIDLRVKLTNEEHREFLDAIEARDMVEAADAIGDQIYILIGNALEFGIPLSLVWRAIHRSNMAKIDPKTGKVLRREDGKIMKPDGWRPPDIKAVLEAAGWKG